MVNGNIYIESLNDLFTELAHPKVPKETHKGLFNKSKTDDRSFLREKMDRCESIYYDLKTKDLDYIGLKNYADFITYLEKVFFYKNICYLNKVTNVSPIDAEKKTICINTSIDITSKTKKIEDARAVLNITEYFDYTADDPRDTVAIDIVRNTGRSIKNGFVIIDGSMKYKDDYDPLSIEPINRLARDYFSELYYDFYRLIWEQQIFNFKYREEYNL